MSGIRTLTTTQQRIGESLLLYYVHKDARKLQTAASADEESLRTTRRSTAGAARGGGTQGARSTASGFGRWQRFGTFRVRLQARRAIIQRPALVETNQPHFTLGCTHCPSCDREHHADGKSGRFGQSVSARTRINKRNRSAATTAPPSGSSPCPCPCPCRMHSLAQKASAMRCRCPRSERAVRLRRGSGSRSRGGAT